MAHADVHRRGLWHQWGVAATVAGAAWQVITGRPDSDWQRGSPLGLAVDGAAPREGARFVFLAWSKRNGGITTPNSSCVRSRMKRRRPST